MSRRRRWGLSSRLLAGQGLVLLVGAASAAVTAAIVGPPIFHAHLIEAGHTPTGPDLEHIEIAYRDASLISLSVSLGIALLAAATVTWAVSRRWRRPLQEVTEAASAVSQGRYGTRVPNVDSDTELDTLATAFNTMAQRLEGMEDTRRRMLSDLAHELRTPIATLAAYHDGLHDGLAELGPESRAVLTEQTERLARLAQDIDDVSTAEEGRLSLDLKHYPVADLVLAAADVARDRCADAGVALLVDEVKAASAVVGVDRVRIAQVMANLIGNALRHTPRGGSITLTADQQGDGVVIDVRDDGEGMSPDQVEHAFERFYRGDSARTRDRAGSGIGLTISRAIVEAHGGALTASSPGLGRGTTLTLVLPLAGPADSTGQGSH